MKRKICLLLCTLLLSLCFVGCSEKREVSESQITLMKQTAEAIFTNFTAMTDEDFAQLASLSDYQMDYTLMTSGLPISAKDFRAMMHSWQTAEDENGEYLSHEGYSVKVLSDGVSLSTETKFEKRKATIVFSFDIDSKLESVDVSGEFSLGEIFKKAGLNTVLGMVIVFSVLILLAVIIYLIQYIPKILNQCSGNSEFLQPKELTTPMATEGTQTISANDLELIAVITAAIAAQEGKSADEFVVRSIRRRPSNHWNS